MSENSLPNIFLAYDIRGKVGTELTNDFAEKVGKAFATWLPQEGPVAVGRDMRPDSEALAQALIAGLTSQGREVWDIGQVTTDMIYFAVGKNGLAGGAVITASHNPGEYNGIKLCREEAQAVGLSSGLADIRDLAAKNEWQQPTKLGSVTQKDMAEGWISHVLSFVDTAKLTELNIAVDAGNGMAGKIFPELEPYVPWNVTEMYFELDGTFPNHEANPLKFETLTDLIALIKKKKLDGGIAFDGDGDRAFLVDETGAVLTGSVMTGMIGEYFLKKNPGASIIYNACVSKSVPEIIVENGGKPVRTKVGHSNIKLVMRQEDSPFGGESSGHFYFRDNWYADSGIIAAVIGLYVATLSGKKLSELRQKYTRYETIPETNFVVDDKEATMKSIEAAFPEATTDHLDGITLDFGNGSWINVRPSNTESILRLNAEAKTQDQLDSLVNKVLTIIK